LVQRGSMSIFELVNEIDNDEIVLPAIQRDFVWDQNRIELLFDSLFRGYPVGIVLLWETYQPIQVRKFSREHTPGGIHKFEENRKGRRIKLVLDGQQRLSSIYVAIKGTFDGRKLYFDVLSGRDTDDHSEVKYRFWFALSDEAKARNVEKNESGKAGAPSKRADMQELEYWLLLSDVIGKNPRDLLKLRNSLAQDLNLSNDDKLRMELNIQNATYALSENSELLKTQTIDSKLPADDEKRKSAFDILEIFVRINTHFPCLVKVWSSHSIATARGASGTRCGRFIFIFSPGIDQMAASRSNSAHSAARSSPGRTKVRASNSRAARVSGAPL
jgi:Protein of unknown function DUF262